MLPLLSYHFFPLPILISLSDTSHTPRVKGLQASPSLSHSIQPAKSYGKVINTGKGRSQQHKREGEAVVWDPRVMKMLN